MLHRSQDTLTFHPLQKNKSVTNNSSGGFPHNNDSYRIIPGHQSREEKSTYREQGFKLQIPQNKHSAWSPSRNSHASTDSNSNILPLLAGNHPAPRGISRNNSNTENTGSTFLGIPGKKSCRSGKIFSFQNLFHQVRRNRGFGGTLYKCAHGH